MAAFSCLRPTTQRGVQILLNTLSKNNSQALLPCRQSQNVIVRHMGASGKHVMPILPSRFIFQVAKDFHHFYFFLGVIVVSAFVTYANIFVGKGVLADIPEGYEPRVWEYHQRPIERFFAKYHTPVEKIYEKNLYIIHKRAERMKYNKLKEAVRAHQKNNDLYRGWYYVPTGRNYDKVLEDKTAIKQDGVPKFKF